MTLKLSANCQFVALPFDRPLTSIVQLREG